MSAGKKTTGKGSKKTQKRKRSQKTRLTVSKPRGPDVEFMGAPLLGDIQAPSGFRVVSYSQAMMEYAEPVLEASHSQDIDDLNETMQTAMLCWNYSIAGELLPGPQTNKEEIIHNIGRLLRISKQEAAGFFKQMIERKSYLFPEELQQKGVPFMVMRKEMTHLITPFDLSRISLSDKPVPPDQKDTKFINDIKKTRLIHHAKSRLRRIRGSVHSGQGGLYGDIRQMACR